MLVSLQESDLAAAPLPLFTSTQQVEVFFMEKQSGLIPHKCEPDGIQRMGKCSAKRKYILV